MRRFAVAVIVAAFVVLILAPATLVAENPGRGISHDQAEGIDGGFYGPEVPGGEPFRRGKYEPPPDPEFGSTLSRIWPHIEKNNFLLAVVPNHPLLQESGIYWAVRRPTPRDRRGPGYEPDEKAVAWAIKVVHEENGMKVLMLYVLGRTDMGSPVVTLWNHSGTSAYDLDGCVGSNSGFVLKPDGQRLRLIKYEPAKNGKSASEHTQIVQTILRVFMTTATTDKNRMEALDFDPARNPGAYPEFRQVECRQPNKEVRP